MMAGTRLLRRLALLMICFGFALAACERPAPGFQHATLAVPATAVPATVAQPTANAAQPTATTQAAAAKETPPAVTSSPTSKPPTAAAPGATALPATSTALPATKAPTSASVSTAAPTAAATATTRPPTATSAPATATTVPATRPPTSVPVTPKRLAFETGATSTSVEDHLAARAVDIYLLRASAGQLMDVTVFAPGNSVKLTVRGSSGELIAGILQGVDNFRGILPKTQDYVLELSAQGQAVNYTLSVLIPQRITFQAGATSTILDGNLVPQRRDHYVLSAEANQLLDLSVIVVGDGVQLIIYGADGTVLKSGMGEGTSFRGLLPKKQDYLIDVGSNRALSYRLQVIIPERISFAAGATSTVVQGGVAVSETHHYILRAAANQTMTVKVTSSSGAVLPTIYGLDGVVLKRALDGQTEWQGKLPSTQEYRIDLISGNKATYKMEVTIK